MIKRKLLLLAASVLLTGSAFAQTDDQQGGEPVASPVRAKLYNSIVSISPIQFTENGVGIAFAFEQGIDKGGIVAYNLPIVTTFNLNNNIDHGDHQDAMFYFSPGIKFYPTTSYGVCKYAVGPSLVIGAGEKTTGHYYYDPIGGGGYYNYDTRSKFILGIMIANSLNINPTPHFYLGLDFGFGFTYINRVGGRNDGMNGIVQGGFKIGYRF